MEAWAQTAALLRRDVVQPWLVLLVLARRRLRRVFRAVLAARSAVKFVLPLSRVLPSMRRMAQPVALRVHRVGARLEPTRPSSEGPDTWQLEARGVPPTPPVGRYIAIGLVVFGVTAGGFGSWAALAPLASASMASGIVKVDSNRKTIQHYDGGIIRDILVRDGDHVRQGQVLIRLDDADARSDFDTLRGQLDALQAREARLIAQRDGLNEIVFPEGLKARKSDVEVAKILEGQQRIFADEARALAAEIAVWRQRAEQYRTQIVAHKARYDALAQQLASLEEEHATAATLLKRGFGRRPRVLGLERQIAGTRSEVAVNEGEIAMLRDQIVEAGLQITALREERARSGSEKLREVQMQAVELSSRMHKSEAEVGRKDIVAPQDGVVVDLRYFTPGGVIAPGAEVMDIVPAEDKLIIEARVRPLDIDVVRAGLPANVHLVAFKQRTTPTLSGIVTRVSADALTDERSGETYFLASIQVSSSEMARVPQVELYPGMPVDVAIVTGERTLLDYLAQPFTDSLALAFRED
jgi:HlyD family type I secretion membrane fusion protein